MARAKVKDDRIGYNLKFKSKKSRERVKRKLKALKEIFGTNVSIALEDLLDRELDGRGIKLENMEELQD